MHKLDLQSRAGARRKGRTGARRQKIAATFLSLLLALSLLAINPGRAELRDAPHADQPTQPCSQRTLLGAALFTPALAANMLAAPEQLKPYIKSISNKRYWGLKDNLQLKAMPAAPTPYVLELAIPKGAINPGNKLAPRGGAGYHWTPALPADLTAACLSYFLWFPQDFDFVKGGKLPGIFGGAGPSGGKKVTGTNGFSTRYMWRANGDGEVYAYIIGNDRRGISIDRGAWRFARGKWIKMEQEIVLNEPGSKDGQVRVWVDGRLVINKTGLVYRTSPDVTISGVMAHVFFGGKDPSWASTKETIVRMTPFHLHWHKPAPKQLLSSTIVQQELKPDGTGN